MRTALKVLVILGLAFALFACSSSGGSGGENLTGGEATCEGPDCGRDEDDTAAPQNPTPNPPGAPDDPTESPEEKPTPPAPLECGGPDAAACPDGYHCVGDPTANCDPATGMDCRGICVLGGDLPECGAFGTGCPEGQACIDDPADDCEGGPAVDCAGVCRPISSGECTDDADCPVLDVRCTICADGSTSCPQSRCDNGKCAVDFEPCSEAQVCGGISGLSCEPGFECVDDPGDDCVEGDAGADCRGICVPEMRPPGCGNSAGEACPPGFACVDLRDDGCDPNDGGQDCPAVCEQVPGRECTSDADCPSVPLPCSVCPDGSEACPNSVCQNGYCSMTVDSCPMPPGCLSDADCPPGHTCAPGADGCDPATGNAECGGVCMPGNEPRACGGSAGDSCPPGFECADDENDDCDPDNGGADCPGKCQPGPTDCGNCASVQAPCNLCPDGTYSCPLPECLDGMCVVYFNPCPDPGFCGGIAGFPCPPGLTCVDKPNDECDPNHGGADCEGICVREEHPLKCGGFAGEACPDGYQCVDAPDDCDPDSGGADCPGFCRPAPGEACASDADCAVIAAPCQMCADGTAACPRSTCVNGQCQAEFPSCGDSPG